MEGDLGHDLLYTSGPPHRINNQESYTNMKVRCSIARPTIQRGSARDWAKVSSSARVAPSAIRPPSAAAGGSTAAWRRRSSTSQKRNAPSPLAIVHVSLWFQRRSRLRRSSPLGGTSSIDHARRSEE